MTIALVVGLVLAPCFVAAAPATAPKSGPPPEGAASSDEAARPTRVPAPSLGGLPARPFVEDGGSSSATGVPPTTSGGTGNHEAETETETESESEAEGNEGPPGTSLRALSCLEGEGGNDTDGARRGVQKRDFLKKRRFELSALGGYYAADALSSTYLYGAALSFFPSEDFGLEVLVARNPVSFRLEEAFTSFDRTRHFQSGVAWSFLGAMLWSPIHAKLRWSERRITHADLLLVAGGGQTWHETAQGVTFQVGVGLKLYLTRFVSMRFDVRDLMVPQEVLGRGRPTHNVITTLGLSLWVPG